MKKERRGLVEPTEIDEIVEEVAAEQKTEPKPGSSPIPTSTNRNTKSYRVRVIASALNVREAPSMNAKAESCLMKGAVRKVAEEKDGFGKIGDNKWINLSSEFVQRV